MNLTARTSEYSLRERHLLPVSTLTAGLTGVGRVDFHQSSASFFRFARQLREKRRPGGVCNTFGKTMMMHHAVYVEVFNTDHTKLVDDFSTVLMGEVLSTPHNTLMDPRHHLAMFPPLRGTFGKFGVLTLDFGKGFL